MNERSPCMDKKEARSRLIQALNLSHSANNTIKNYLRYFDRFIEWVEAETDILDLNDLTLFHVHDYLALIDSFDKYAPKTYNLYVYSIRMFYGSVLDRAVDKYKFPVKKDRSKPKPYFIPSQVNQFLDGCQDRQLRAAIALAAGCGLRISEIMRLQFGDFNKAQKLVLIRDSKGHKTRYVQFSSSVSRILREYCRTAGMLDWKKSDFLFPEKKKPGQHAKSSNLTHRFLAYAQTFEFFLEGHSFHSLRHAYATQLAMKGVPLPMIAKSMGHTSVATTAKYIHLPEDTEYELPDCLDPDEEEK